MKTEKVDVESVRVVDPEPPMLPGRVTRPAAVSGVRPAAQKKKGWGGTVVWLLVLGALGAGIYFGWPYLTKLLEGNAPKGRPPRPMAPVVVAPAERGDLALYLDEIGTVAPLNTVTVRTRVDGQLTKVLFKEGQMVKEGDLLAEIDPRPFQVQLEQAQGALQKDQALLENAKADLARYEKAKEAVSEQLLTTAAATVRQYEGNIATDQGQINAAKVNLSYCEIRSPLTGRVGLRLVDQGNIVHASDANGLVVITQEQPITVYFSVPQDELPTVLPKLHAGVPLKVDVLDRLLTTKLGSGTVVATDSEIDPTTASLKFRAVCGNESGMLFPSQAVDARLYTDTLKDVVIVPAVAVQIDADSQPFVYVVKKGAATQPAEGAEGQEGAGQASEAGGAAARGGGAGGRGATGTVEMRTVKEGPQEGDRIVIESGVAPGELVVTKGVDKLQDGARVQIGREEAGVEAATSQAARSVAGETGSAGAATLDKTGTGSGAGAGAREGGRRKRPAK
ncbi:MAG: efflux RND transporter periplasmic adaptor subunit [Phycisphaerae bacterium]